MTFSKAVDRSPSRSCAWRIRQRWPPPLPWSPPRLTVVPPACRRRLRPLLCGSNSSRRAHPSNNSSSVQRSSSNAAGGTGGPTAGSSSSSHLAHLTLAAHGFASTRGLLCRVRRVAAVVAQEATSSVVVRASLAPLLRLTRFSVHLSHQLGPPHDLCPSADGIRGQCLGDGHWGVHTHALFRRYPSLSPPSCSLGFNAIQSIHSLYTSLFLLYGITRLGFGILGYTLRCCHLCPCLLVSPVVLQRAAGAPPRQPPSMPPWRSLMISGGGSALLRSGSC